MPVLKYTTDTSQAVSEVRKLNDVAGRESQEAIKKTADESRRLSTLQKQLLRESSTAQENYNKKLEALKGLYEKNLISADKYREGVKKATVIYEANKLAANDAAAAGDKAFGSKAAQSLVSFATQLGAVLGPIALIRLAWDEVAQAKQKAFDVNREARFKSGQLRQLADTQAEYDELRKKQRELFASGATRTLGEAGQIVFDITSAGLMEDASFRLLKELGRTGTIEDLSGFAQTITRLSSAFGAAEAGGTKAIISKAFAASEFSSANVPQLLSAAAKVGPVANLLKLTDEETMAAITALSKTSTAEDAATALNSLLYSTAEKPEFEGMSIAERVQKLRSMNLKAGEMKEYLGRKEAVRAYSDLMQTSDIFRKTHAAVIQANKDTFAVDRKLAFKDLITEAAAGVEAAEAQQIVDFEKPAALGKYVSSIQQRIRTSELAESTGPMRMVNSLFGVLERTIQEPVNKMVLGAESQAERLLKDSRVTEDEKKILERLLKATEDGVKEQKETNRKLSEGGLIGVAE
ncbi:hypothetical protein EH220_03055 [bacterium]|nr:MAG: hypothetical protein EH220_03055 [bacterium]